MLNKIVLICLILVSSVFAQDVPVAGYAGGMLLFDYDAYWGSYGGEFYAQGKTLPESGEFPIGQTEACGGGFSTSNDTTMVVAYGAILNDDDTVDFSLLLIREQGESISSGSHPIDTETFMSLALFFDNVSDFVAPEDPNSIEEWLNAIVADYKFVSTSGNISVTSCDEFGFTGSFNITMIDPDSFTMISADQASFDFYGLGFPSSVYEMPSVISNLTASPNPFNPRTEISFELASDSIVRVEIFNANGELVDSVANGYYLAGLNSFTWTGCSSDGSKLSSGVYLYKITANNQIASGKIVFVP
jgi:hypothetical protein